nr:hypothetical protein [Tanacetum cinerariifolium]
MTWLDYDENVDSLSTMGNEVGITSPEITTQTLPSFKEYTPPVTYPKEVEKTLGIPIMVEPEPQPLLNSPSLDVSLGDIIGLEPPIKPHNPNSSRMKVVDYLTAQTPPSPHVANSRLKCVYSYYNPESKEVSPLGEELSLFDRPNEVERGRILEAHRLEHILQQQISQRMTLSHHDGNGYQRKGQNQSHNRTKSKPKPDKIKHEMESVEKSIKSKPKSKSNQSKPGTNLERARKTEAEGINILLGQL